MDDLVYNERTGEFEPVSRARAGARAARAVGERVACALGKSVHVVGSALIGFVYGMAVGMGENLPRVKSGIEAYCGKMTENR